MRKTVGGCCQLPAALWPSCGWRLPWQEPGHRLPSRPALPLSQHPWGLRAHLKSRGWGGGGSFLNVARIQ